MHQAIGYCASAFYPSEPGRLCRGRERWIDSFEVEAAEPIHRLVISGATFTDDSARDAQRGLLYSGIDAPTLIRQIFPEAHVMAWAEDANPQQVPELARGLESYDQAMCRGPLRRWAVRWSMVCEEDEHIRQAMQAGSDVFVIFDSPPPEAEQSELRSSGMPPLADSHLDLQNQGGFNEAFRGLLFLLTGYRNDGPPFRGFQPTALPELLGQEGVVAVILVHQDKHAPCIGIYANGDGQGLLDRLQALGPEKGTLVVPFAIPPMLARWDRALWELRQIWDADTLGEFPVPESDDSRSWGRRHQAYAAEAENSDADGESISADTQTDSTDADSVEIDVDEQDGEDTDFQDDDSEDVDGDAESSDDDGDDRDEDAFADDDFGDLDDAFGDIEVSANEEDDDSSEEVVTEKDSPDSDSTTDD